MKDSMDDSRLFGDADNYRTKNNITFSFGRAQGRLDTRCRPDPVASVVVVVWPVKGFGDVGEQGRSGGPGFGGG
jgi:hypothetical protein